MSDRDGRGLPPAAVARLARMGTSGVASSLLSAPSAVTLETVGLSAVGEVMGCIVEHIGWQGYGGCGYYGGFGSAFRTMSSGQRGSAFTGFRPYLDALNRGYDTALGRLEEAKALGADGVVGIQMTVGHLDAGAREFVAMGTAVRARSAIRPAFPFTTDLAGTEVAKLMHAGWVPVSIAVGLEVAIRHDDYRTQNQASWFNGGNVEVSGYTDLVQHARHFARQRFAERTALAGADGAIVSSMHLRIWELEPGEGHTDHVAEATVAGTTLARFHGSSPAPTRSLTVMPLRPRSRT